MTDTENVVTTSDVLTHAINKDAVSLGAAVGDLISRKAVDILANKYDDVEQDLLGVGDEEEVDTEEDESEDESEESENESDDESEESEDESEEDDE